MNTLRFLTSQLKKAQIFNENLLKVSFPELMWETFAGEALRPWFPCLRLCDHVDSVLQDFSPSPSAETTNVTSVWRLKNVPCPFPNHDALYVGTVLNSGIVCLGADTKE